MPNSLSNAILSSSPAPHTAYGYVIGLLLTLVGIKYQGSDTNPFKEHGPIMLLFLITILVYIIALTHQKCHADNVDDNSPILSFYLCHISGALSCELLVLILIPPIWWFVVNLSLALVVLALFFFDHHESLLSLGGTYSVNGQEDPSVEMVEQSSA